MAGWIDTAIYQTIIATQGRGWIGKLFEYLEWLCTQSSTARIIFLPVSRLYLWFVICWLLPLSQLDIAPSAPCCPLSDTRGPRIAPGSQMSRLHCSIARCHWHDWPIIIITNTHSQDESHTQASFWLGGVILLRWPKKCLMRGMIGREIRRLSGTISYHLSWRPPPTLTHLILDHSQRSAQFIFYSSSK